MFTGPRWKVGLLQPSENGRVEGFLWIRIHNVKCTTAVHNRLDYRPYIVGYSIALYRLVEILLIRRVIDSPICEYCSHEDILIHFMYQCACVRIIWDTMFDKMGTSKNENAMNAAALFGVPGGEDANNVVVLWTPASAARLWNRKHAKFGIFGVLLAMIPT